MYYRGAIMRRQQFSAVSIMSWAYFILLTLLVHVKETWPQSSEFFYTQGQQHQDMSVYGWKKFSVVVPYEDVLNPDLAPGTQVVPALSFLTSENVVLSLKLDDQIGRFNQRCILPPARLGSDPVADERDYYNWECTWVFELNLRGSRPGTITLQGPFNRIFRPTETEDNIYPRDGLAPPDKQFVTITGGTGCFRAIIGVVKIQVQDPLAIPPILRYTFYIKIYD